MKILAHRGLHRGDPNRENRREAVRETLNSTVHGLEVDIQLLSGGQFVLHHDDYLSPDRFDVAHPKPLNALTLEKLQGIADQLLTLGEVFDLDWQGKKFVFECKPSRNRYAFSRAFCKRLSELYGSEQSHKFIISCSDIMLLQQLRQQFDPTFLAPVITRSNPCNQFVKESLHWGEYHVREDLCTSGAFNNKSWFPEETIAWTVNDEVRVRQLERIGIKGIMTDNQSLIP